MLPPCVPAVGRDGPGHEFAKNGWKAAKDSKRGHHVKSTFFADESGKRHRSIRAEIGWKLAIRRLRFFWPLRRCQVRYQLEDASLNLRFLQQRLFDFRIE